MSAEIIMYSICGKVEIETISNSAQVHMLLRTME